MILCTAGDSYEGSFLEGRKSGGGLLRFTSQSGEQILYEGEFLDDLMHGQGGCWGGLFAKVGSEWTI